MITSDAITAEQTNTSFHKGQGAAIEGVSRHRVSMATTQYLQLENSCGQYSHKTFFTEAGNRLDVDHRLSFANPWLIRRKSKTQKVFLKSTSQWYHTLKAWHLFPQLAEQTAVKCKKPSIPTTHPFLFQLRSPEAKVPQLQETRLKYRTGQTSDGCSHDTMLFIRQKEQTGA